MIYDIGFTNHFFEDRLINTKKEKRINISKGRACRKTYTKDFIKFLLTPYYDKLINQFDKFLFIFNNNNYNNEKTYLLLASENNKLIMISALTSSSDFIKYKNIKLENIIRIDDLYFEDILLSYKKIQELKHTIKPTISVEHKAKRKQGLNKIVVEKPKENKFKMFYDLINSFKFKYFRIEEQNKILKERDILYFYENFNFIFDESKIEDFTKTYNKLQTVISLEETKEITLEYINYIINEINKYNDNKQSIVFLKSQITNDNIDEINEKIKSKLSLQNELNTLKNFIN